MGITPEETRQLRKRRSKVYASTFSSPIGKKLLAIMIQDSGMMMDDDAAEPGNEYQCVLARGQAKFMSHILRSCADGGLEIPMLAGGQWKTGEMLSQKESTELDLSGSTI